MLQGVPHDYYHETEGDTETILSGDKEEQDEWVMQDKEQLPPLSYKRRVSYKYDDSNLDTIPDEGDYNEYDTENNVTWDDHSWRDRAMGGLATAWRGNTHTHTQIHTDERPRIIHNRRQSLSFNYFKSVISTFTSFLHITPVFLQKQTPQKQKKYVLQTAEFYGADFSAPPENEELAELEQRRVVHGEGDGGEGGRVRAEQGTVFIAALSSVASRADDWDRYRDVKRDGGGSLTISRRTSLVGEEGHSNITSKITLTVPQKPWSESIRDRMPAIDYSDVFPSDIGHTTGLAIFRIESLKPALLPSTHHGQFCIADAYIILHTSSSSKIDTQYDTHDDVDHTVYTWIGPSSELDKRFCTAMFSVGLRNWINCSSPITRETPTEESPTFLSLFRKFTITDPSHATESGLFMAEEKRYPLRLYRLVGRDVRLVLVEPKWWELKTVNVVLLDAGLEIYQWNGAKASLQHKSKARMLADRINNLERGGKATKFEFGKLSTFIFVIHSLFTEFVDEWDEIPQFWELLGGERTIEDVTDGKKFIITHLHHSLII